MKEKEEDLTLFLEMQRREEERNCILLHDSEGTDASPTETKPCKSPISKIQANDFFNSENEKTDYDWLLTPPSDPLFPSLEKEVQKTLMSQITTTNASPTALNCQLANPLVETASRGNVASRQQVPSTSQNSSSGGNRRSSSSGRPAPTASRSATPTSRPTLPSNARTSRASTPTSRTTYPSSKPAAARSSTPTRSSARTTSRTSVPVSKPTSRSATPTHRPSAPLSASSQSAPSGRSSSVTKLGPAVLRTSAPSRGTSPMQKSQMPGLSLEAPRNLRTSLAVRTASASRCRPAAPSDGSSSTSSNGRPKRNSCSPSRGQAQPGNSFGSRTSVPAKNRTCSNGNDNVTPVMVGTKMVERVVNMRKLAPPKQDDNPPSHKKSLGKPLPSSQNSGFGRTLSKISLDMALRHMDIGQGAPGNLRPLITEFPASLKHNAKSLQASDRENGVSSSPLTTRSNASSEQSVHNNFHCFGGSEVEGSDLSSERGQLSPPPIHGR